MLAQIQANLAQIQAAVPSPIAAAGMADERTQSFAEHMGVMLRSVDDQDKRAGELMAAVERGASDDLVGAMLSSQQAGLSFSMMMQVRNKVMGAVDELIKLPL
jgi:flagellar hook-basal body complex protein FliE